MSSLDGKVAIITGAAHGLGREHALYLAKEGVKVVVNDIGADVDGEGRDSKAAVSRSSASSACSPNTCGKCCGCSLPSMTLQSVTVSGPPRR